MSVGENCRRLLAGPRATPYPLLVLVRPHPSLRFEEEITRITAMKGGLYRGLSIILSNNRSSEISSPSRLKAAEKYSHSPQNMAGADVRTPDNTRVLPNPDSLGSLCRQESGQFPSGQNVAKNGGTPDVDIRTHCGSVCKAISLVLILYVYYDGVAVRCHKITD